MELIIMSAIGGALILFGVQKRINTDKEYWDSMKRIADAGKDQQDYLPTLDAGRSTGRMNGNIAIGAGVLVLLAMVAG